MAFTKKGQNMYTVTITDAFNNTVQTTGDRIMVIAATYGTQEVQEKFGVFGDSNPDETKMSLRDAVNQADDGAYDEPGPDTWWTISRGL